MRGNSLVTGELSSQRPVTQSFDVFIDLHLNKWLSKRSRHWWFGMPSGHAHYDITVMKSKIFNVFSLYIIVACALALKLRTCKWYSTLLIINQHWFRWWLGAIRHQAITWTNVDPDLCPHMVSLGMNSLPQEIWMKFWISYFLIKFSNWWLRYLSHEIALSSNCHWASPKISRHWFR